MYFAPLGPIKLLTKLTPALNDFELTYLSLATKALPSSTSSILFNVVGSSAIGCSTTGCSTTGSSTLGLSKIVFCLTGSGSSGLF